MNQDEARRQHDTTGLVGFRARPVAIGLAQLVRELASAGVLAPEAVARIKGAIADELTVNRPVGRNADEFRSRVTSWLDRLF